MLVDVSLFFSLVQGRGKEESQAGRGGSLLFEIEGGSLSEELEGRIVRSCGREGVCWGGGGRRAIFFQGLKFPPRIESFTFFFSRAGLGAESLMVLLVSMAPYMP